ncbi:RagB/SusD family nutrient uptake outer membrane protein [Pedobacter sp. UBA4863]|uniref:RagB/SusD family nutrient uptake outer membrane protein n=1 Tax=Pedobacter sp. UBA4863 TaxID=1947060 RepID=UPI0025CFBA66|nr:RagB/SusD family nutrient uptake outer membrane protein [Pedobacter sp. UBA4863]
MKSLNKIIIGIMLLTLSSSCKDFLTVNPKTDVARDELFATEEGFKDALIGIYIQIGEDSSYGKELTMTSIEHLVSSWSVTVNSAAAHLNRFNYTDAGAENSLQNIFNKQYKTIAGINTILDQVENKRHVFSPGMYELIKGECLALRGLLHFDMLRLFGPVPTLAASANRLPPYVSTFSKKQTAAPSFIEFKTSLFKDLEEAQQLLGKSDPFLNNSITDFKNGTYRANDQFVNHRYLRMNYYANTALKARAHLWFNEPQKAYEQAILVINAKNPDASAKFKLGTSADFAANNFVLTSEQIFGLYDHNINTKFSSPMLYKGTDATVVKSQLYGNTGTDIRENNLWVVDIQSSVSRYIFKKYDFTKSAADLLQDTKQIPMLRLAEMYLIAIETGPDTDAQNLWTAYQTARNLVQTNLPTDATQKRDLVIKEYRKEFFGEGQAFYAYKRVNASPAQVTFLSGGIDVNYTPPLPKSETTIN